MAHPGTTRSDQIIPDMVEAGLTAIEVFHSAHDADAEARYRALAGRLGLEMTGGSDYHGPGSRRAEFFGRTAVPREVFASFCRAAVRRCDVPTAVLDACAND